MSDITVSTLDPVKHRRLKIIHETSYKWAEKMGYIPITLHEIAEFAGKFPLVFTTDKLPRLVMLTGIGTDRNLGLDEEGQWKGKYIPAFLKRYPFFLSRTGMNEEGHSKYTVAIDENASCLSEERGIALWEGEEISSYVKNITKSLTNFEQELLKVQSLGKLFQEAGILEKREFKIEVNGKTKVVASGFLAVNNVKLHELDDETLATWIRLGYMNVISLHLYSSRNVVTLLEQVI